MSKSKVINQVTIKFNPPITLEYFEKLKEELKEEIPVLEKFDFTGFEIPEIDQKDLKYLVKLEEELNGFDFKDLIDLTGCKQPVQLVDNG